MPLFFAIFLAVAFSAVAALGVYGVASRESDRLRLLVRLLVALALLPLAAFCAFGFLASYEAPGSPGFGAASAATFLLSIASAGRLVLPGKRRGGGDTGAARAGGDVAPRCSV
jgi:hypothetical protein